MRTTLLCALGLLGLAALAAGTQHHVAQKGKAFSQETVQLTAGDTLIIENQDSVVHHLFSMTPGYTLDEAQAPNTKTELGFEEAGEVEIRCAIHPEMKLKVQVEAP